MSAQIVDLATRRAQKKEKDKDVIVMSPPRGTDFESEYRYFKWVFNQEPRID